MKRIILLMLIIIAGVGLVWMTLNMKDSVIRIGVIGDYSTNGSTASVEAFRAVELAVDQLNEAATNYTLKRFNLGDYGRMSALKDDLVKANIDVVMGPSTSSQYVLVKEVLDGLDLPVFLLAVSSDAITDKEDNLFRLTDTLQEQVEALKKALEHYVTLQGIQVYYTSENSSFSKPYAENLCELIGNTSEKIEVGDLSDGGVQALLLEKKQAEAFVIIAGPGHAGIIADLLSKNNPHVPIVFPAWSKSNRILDYTLAVDNPMYILSSAEPLRSEAYQTFERTFEDEKNLGVTSFSYFGYEMMYFIDAVQNHVDLRQLESIKTYIHGLNSYEGVFNDFTLNDAGDGKRGYALLEIVKGTFVVVESVLD